MGKIWDKKDTERDIESDIERDTQERHLTKYLKSTQMTLKRHSIDTQ